MKKLVLAILFVLSLLSVPVLAAESTDYQISDIKIDDISYANTVYVERGATIEIEVFMLGLGETEDVNVKTWLGGYEYDNVQTTSSMFDIEDGVSYKKTLSLQLPDDMNSEQDYSLYVEVYDDENQVREEATLRVSSVRHDVRIQDVIVDSAVEAGDYTSVTVRLENMGDNKEEDVKIEVSSEELGVSVSTYLDELTNEEVDNEDEEDSGDVTLNFRVDDETLTGAYDLTVTVTYNNGYNVVEETASLNVDGVESDEGEVVVIVSDETGNEDNTKDFSTALKLGFGILAVLIVILALILIVRR